MSRTARQLTGDEAEATAERFLHQAGLRTHTHNYRCRQGEIDLVMLDPGEEPPEILVFVEVRARAPGALVDAIETIDAHKQRRLIQAARHFLRAHPDLQAHPCRFDVVGLEGAGKRPCWIPNAFETG